MTVDLAWRGAFDNVEVSRLHAGTCDTRVFSAAEWNWVAQVAAQSCGWVVAREDSELVGFLNVVSDGSVWTSRTPWRPSTWAPGVHTRRCRAVAAVRNEI